MSWKIGGAEGWSGGENCECCGGEGAQIVEKDRECTGDCRRKTLPQNHLLGKGERLTTTSLHKQQSSKSEVSEVCIITGGVSVAPVGKEGRGLGAGSMVWGSPGPPGEKLFSLWERWHGFSEDKRTGCSSMLPWSLAYEERHQLMAVYFGTSLWLCFAINSELQCGPMTASKGQTGTDQTVVMPFPRVSVGVGAPQSPKIRSVWSPVAPEIKHRSTMLTWQADSLDIDRVRAGIWWKLGTQERWLVFCERFLKSGSTKIPIQGIRKWGDTIYAPLSTSTNILQGATRAIQWSLEPLTPNPPVSCRCISTRISLPENQHSRSHPQKTSTNPSHTQSLLIIECCKTSR